MSCPIVEEADLVKFFFYLFIYLFIYLFFIIFHQNEGTYVQG